MPGIWNRHPRYSLLVFVVLAATLYFLVPVHYEHSVAPHFTLKDNDLPSRMARASRIYDKVLEDRKKLMKTFGPTPKDISMSVALLCLYEYPSLSALQVPRGQVPLASLHSLYVAVSIILLALIDHTTTNRGLLPSCIQLPT